MATEVAKCALNFATSQVALVDSAFSTILQDASLVEEDRQRNVREIFAAFEQARVEGVEPAVDAVEGAERVVREALEDANEIMRLVNEVESRE